MSTRRLSAVLFVAALSAAPAVLFAEALIKRVPTPDLSKMPLAQADELRNTRDSFEEAKAKLVGEPLAEVYAILGAAYAQAGLLDAAAVALEDAAQLSPSDGRWVYAQGVVARLQKQNAVAQNYFELALQLDRDYAPIVVTVARSKFDNGDLDGANKLLSGYVVKHTSDAVPYALLGQIALRQKRYADAVDQTQKALALQPQATQLYATLADAQVGAGNAKGAAEARSKAGDVAPALTDPIGNGITGVNPGRGAAPVDAVTGHVNDAASFMAMRQYPQARHELDEALKSNPGDSTLLAFYARIEAAAGNLPGAKARAAEAVAAGRSNAVAFLSQGVVLETANDDAGAQRAYEEAVRLEPKLAEARLRLGTLLMRTGRTDDAIVQFRALVQLDIRNTESWMRLVAADTGSGHCASSLRDVTDVLATDAGNTFVLQLFVRIASTCPAASAEQRRGALEYGAKLYGQSQSAQAGEAYALAFAANDKWDEAIKIQQAAMFLLVRNGLKDALPPFREVLQQLQAHKRPQLPWPASAAMYHPTRPSVQAAPAAANPAK
jgi:tetratricopeptide (TPR) repeat protein